MGDTSINFERLLERCRRLAAGKADRKFLEEVCSLVAPLVAQLSKGAGS